MHSDDTLESRNRHLMGKLLVAAAGMLCFAFALVPLYRQICAALDIDQMRVVGSANTQVDPGRDITIELVASSAGLPWIFQAIDRTITLHPGELATARFRVVNTLGRPVTARAVMNTAPAAAARYIEKRECFCFTSQTLAAGEEREMPVVFRVRPDAPAGLTTMSLSYTFFEMRGA